MLGGDRFIREIKTTASLQHPHIVPLFDSGTADGFLFYVMPYIEGETLRDKLDRLAQPRSLRANVSSEQIVTAARAFDLMLFSDRLTRAARQ